MLDLRNLVVIGYGCPARAGRGRRPAAGCAARAIHRTITEGCR
ncbi:unnamed protein product [[Actinomadura] parvosata subsp. kistnae]|nr:unnamed protein product [Actinomadura parvosata subsp. kistnae]